MKKNVKKSQVATKKQTYLCVDLTTTMKENDLQVMENRRGTLGRSDEDKFFFIEKGVRPYGSRPWKCWSLIDRSRNGKVSANDSHIKVELYFHHDEYGDGRDLADQMATQIEQMGETLCETNLAELVEQIRSLKETD